VTRHAHNETKVRGGYTHAELVFDVNAIPRLVESVSVPVASPTEALYFPREAPRLFGWLHLPTAEEACDTGLVICKPFGYEALCGHRSMRAFAEMAAALGVPALRFDYLGSGDSANIDPNSDQIETWCRDVLAAVDELRVRTGVTRVCLLGFRLGAVLATLAAARSQSVDGLILVAPVISGARYLREMRTTRLAALLGAGVESSASDGSGDVAAAVAGSMEVSGHSVSAATIAALSRIDLAALGAPRVSGMLVIDRDDLPTARAWLDSLSGCGAQAEYAALPGFVKMMMTAPQYTLIPHAMISATQDWLSRFVSLRSGNSHPGGARREPEAAAAPVLAVPGEPVDGVVSERPVRFGPGGLMFGIVTEPSGRERRRRGVVLVNTGADYHIGAGRMNVSLARRWARRGYVVLRMDLAGLGDSDTRQGMPDNEVFPPAAVEDVRAAIEFLRERYQVGDLTLAGLCSGAYHALRAAVAAVPLNRILMVNPETFSWKPGTSMDAIHLAEVVRTPGVYRARLLSIAHWSKLLAGRVDVDRIARLYARRIGLSLESALRQVRRLLRIPLPDDLGWQLEQIAARGILTTIVFSRGEPGIELLRMQGGSAIQRLGERFRVHIVDGADHTFSRSSERAILEKILSDELFAR
jgi:alpha-beta hydrolase superfamily lysophospholipase